ncbi:MAG: helix-turn-helix transcriptional regulator [Oscillibacter sp.]|nr:helix-turn-helix transcriptional regulator [Oscillibacter sp.]MCI9376734.1 helix-turn-helix transcriptional regulator [Oscillibacter sp.]
MDIFAENLIILRKARGLSRQVVSDAVHISAKSYERYEKNEREPSLSIAYALADFYGVAIDQLAGRAPLPENPEKGA